MCWLSSSFSLWLCFIYFLWFSFCFSPLSFVFLFSPFLYHIVFIVTFRHLAVSFYQSIHVYFLHICFSLFLLFPLSCILSDSFFYLFIILSLLACLSLILDFLLAITLSLCSLYYFVVSPSLFLSPFLCLNSDLRVNRNPSLSLSNFGWKVGVGVWVEEERRAELGGGVAERPQRGVPALPRGPDRAKEQKRRKKRSKRGRERGRDGEWRDLHSSPGFGRQLPPGQLQRAQEAILQERRILPAHQPGRTSGWHPREERPQQ